VPEPVFAPDEQAVRTTPQHTAQIRPVASLVRSLTTVPLPDRPGGIVARRGS